MAMSDLEINALGIIYEAMMAVDDARTDSNVPKEIRSNLSRLYRALDNARSMIIRKQVEQYLVKLEGKSNEISVIVGGIKKDIAKIKSLATTIDNAAGAIKFLVNTAKAAMSAGLL